MSTLDALRRFSEDLQRQNLGHPEQVTIGRRAFEQLLGEAEPYILKRTKDANLRYVTAVTVALDYGPCLVHVGKWA